MFTGERLQLEIGRGLVQHGRIYRPSLQVRKAIGRQLPTEDQPQDQKAYTDASDQARQENRNRTVFRTSPLSRNLTLPRGSEDMSAQVAEVSRHQG